jgi:NAD-dependent DNA ligase
VDVEDDAIEASQYAVFDGLPDDVFVEFEPEERYDIPSLADIHQDKINKYIGIEVCFTGFDFEDKDKLKKIASMLGMIPRSGTTKGLNLLVCGRRAGPAKIQRAKERNIDIIGFDEFKNKFIDQI